MEYQEFMKKVEQELLRYLPKNGNYQIEKKWIPKENGLSYDGLLIQSDNLQNTPILHLQNYYQIYRRDGIPFTQILVQMAEDYKRFVSQTPQWSMQEIHAHIPEDLFVRAVNYELSKEWLEEVPYEKVLDVALIPAVRLEENISAKISHSNAKMLGLSGKEILELAKARNLEHGVSFENLSDKLQSLQRSMGVQIPEEYRQNEDSPIFVLSNADNFYGASLLFQPEMQAILAEAMGDFCVLPSSGHEVLLVQDQGLSLGDFIFLQKTVMDINRTDVEPEDFLSDTVYRFNSKTQELTIAMPSPIKVPKKSTTIHFPRR